MTETVYNNVVRRVLAATVEELHAVLASLPHGVRFGVARQLDETGEAHRYECARHCAYYLRRRPEEHDDIEVWRWNYVASEREAGRLRALIAALREPLDAARADRLFEQATFRTVDNPRPIGAAFMALDFGGYPALRAVAAAVPRAAAGAKPAA